MNKNNPKKIQQPVSKAESKSDIKQEQSSESFKEKVNDKPSIEPHGLDYSSARKSSAGSVKSEKPKEEPKYNVVIPHQDSANSADSNNSVKNNYDKEIERQKSLDSFKINDTQKYSPPSSPKDQNSARSNEPTKSFNNEQNNVETKKLSRENSSNSIGNQNQKYNQQNNNVSSPRKNSASSNKSLNITQNINGISNPSQQIIKEKSEDDTPEPTQQQQQQQQDSSEHEVTRLDNTNRPSKFVSDNTRLSKFVSDNSKPSKFVSDIRPTILQENTKDSIKIDETENERKILQPNDDILEPNQVRQQSPKPNSPSSQNFKNNDDASSTSQNDDGDKTINQNQSINDLPQINNQQAPPDPQLKPEPPSMIDYSSQDPLPDSPPSLSNDPPPQTNMSHDDPNTSFNNQTPADRLPDISPREKPSIVGTTSQIQPDSPSNETNKSFDFIYPPPLVRTGSPAIPPPAENQNEIPPDAIFQPEIQTIESPRDNHNPIDPPPVCEITQSVTPLEPGPSLNTNIIPPTNLLVSSSNPKIEPQVLPPPQPTSNVIPQNDEKTVLPVKPSTNVDLQNPNIPIVQPAPQPGPAQPLKPPAANVIPQNLSGDPPVKPPTLINQNIPQPTSSNVHPTPTPKTPPRQVSNNQIKPGVFITINTNTNIIHPVAGQQIQNPKQNNQVVPANINIPTQQISRPVQPVTPVINTQTNFVPSSPAVIPANVANLLPDDGDVNSSQFKIPKIAPLPIAGLPNTYGTLTWSQKIEIPPKKISFEEFANSHPAEINASDILSLSNEKAKELFVAFVYSSCCYGKKTAEDCEIFKVTAFNAYDYSLESFTEKRYVTYTFTSYRGESLDSPKNGPIPNPWDIEVITDFQFTNNVKKIRVPHTEQLMGCFRCNGFGNLKCSGCGGSGRRGCYTCHGARCIDQLKPDGTHEKVICSACSGSGSLNCIRCNSKGAITCTVCNGYTKLKCYLEIEVNFINHQDNYIVENTALPDNLIKDVNGQEILLQTMPQLQPITEFSIESILNSSKAFFEKHRRFFQSEYLLMQRQRLELVPVYECEYRFNNFEGKFWIYGLELKVYCTDYPESCCGCCCCCSCCSKCTIL